VSFWKEEYNYSFNNNFTIYVSGTRLIGEHSAEKH